MFLNERMQGLKRGEEIALDEKGVNLPGGRGECWWWWGIGGQTFNIKSRPSQHEIVSSKEFG